MSNARRSHRIRIGVIVAVLLGLALGSFWVLELMRRNHGEIAPQVTKGEPDYIVDTFTFVRMSKTGHARYKIAGEKLSHYPDNDSFEIQQPRLHNLAQHQSPMSVRAERAVIEHVANKVHLYRAIKVDQPAFESHPHFELNTDYLLVLPDDDVMRTDKPVKIQLGLSRLAGVGMYTNNATRELRLAQSVQATFQTAAR